MNIFSLSEHFHFCECSICSNTPLPLPDRAQIATVFWLLGLGKLLLSVWMTGAAASILVDRIGKTVGLGRYKSRILVTQDRNNRVDATQDCLRGSESRC